MKKISFILLSIILICSQFNFAETSENMTPGWVYGLSIGTLLFISGHWYYTNYISDKPEKKVSVKDSTWSEIRYIANKNEEERFRKITKSENIKLFLKSFWKNRDPSPKTSKNEFKQQYYKRIRYSKNNFSTGFEKGHKSDRGRIYILYGPPDEIENYPWSQFSSDVLSDLGDEYNHTAKAIFGSDVYAIEIWLYYQPAGSFGSNKIFSSINPGGMKFVFADLGGYGGIQMIFSTEYGYVRP